MSYTLGRFIAVLTLLLILFSTSSCGGNGSSDPSPPVTGKKWTVMVYLDADNNLGTASMLDLEEMQTVGSSANVTFIVQHDTNGGNTKRYRVEKGLLTLLSDLGELDMSAASTLRDFVRYSATAYPADHYALIIWNHGQGWKNALQGSRFKSIFNDVDNGNPSNYLSNYYVAAALAEAQSAAGFKLDILGIDACEMAVLEAAYEFRNVARILVASQELVDYHGWYYSDLFARLVNNPTITPKELAKAMVLSFKKFYEDGGYKTQTISAIALDPLYSNDGVTSIGTLAQTVNGMALRLASRMADTGTRSTTLKLLTDARARVQEFDQDVLPATYVDLIHLSRLIDGAGSSVETTYNKLLLGEYHGSERPNAHGLSIVFYDRSSPYDNVVYDTDYRGYNESTGTGSRIAFLNQYQWDDMLHTYFGLQYPLKPN